MSMTTNKQALREAAEKFRTTYAAHCQNPRNYEALDAWDKATSEFVAAINNDELNIIASLLDEMDMETGYREGAFVACNRWHDKFREAEAKLESAEKRIAELEAAERRVTEIELPLPTCTYADHSYPAYSKKQVIQILASAGITTKGE